jgi:inosine/xanthosine triphosphatase
MKRVCVVSKNPVKVEATKIGFERMFPNEEFVFLGLSAPSQVPDQPLTDIQTKQGAINRVVNAKSLYENYDYYVAIEGGVEKQNSGYYDSFAWVAIESQDKITFSRASTFTIPKEVGKFIDEGKELGDANDIVFNKTNSKQQNGAIGLLTNDIITRTTYYIEPITMALIPFKNLNLYI